MAKRDLLKEAIADAKAVKETAIANAKAALEESFAPMLREKLAAKLAEMDEMDEEEEIKEVEDTNEEEIEETYDSTEEGMDYSAEEEVEEELDLDELLRELDELDEEDSIDEALGTVNDPDTPTAHGNIAEEEEEEEEEVEGEEEEEEEIDLENMDEDDLKKFIEDVIADMVEAGELEAGEGMEGEGEEEEGEEEETEEVTEGKKSLKEYIDPVSLTIVGALVAGAGGAIVKAYKSFKDEQKAETAKELAALVKGGMDPEKAAIEATKKVDAKMSASPGSDKYTGSQRGGATGAMNLEEKEVNENIMGSWQEAAQLLGTTIEGAKMFSVALGASLPALLGIIGYFGQDAISWAKKTYNKLTGKQLPAEGAESGEMMEEEDELTEAYKTIRTIKNQLAEVNLFNAKLLYTNKIFKSKNLTESQKVKVLAAFDKAVSIKEAKLVYETLSEGFTSKKAPVNESLIRGGASRPSGVAVKKPIMETNDQFSRWQKLAGITK